MVIKAGVIYSMAEAREADARTFQAMAVRDGRIMAPAPESEGADDLIGADTVVVDDPGLIVLPACDDTHTHLIFAGRPVNDVQVADAKDQGEFLGMIRRRAAGTPDGQWIRTASNWAQGRMACVPRGSLPVPWRAGPGRGSRSSAASLVMWAGRRARFLGAR